jgi:hypothetical protein
MPRRQSRPIDRRRRSFRWGALLLNLLLVLALPAPASQAAGTADHNHHGEPRWFVQPHLAIGTFSVIEEALLGSYEFADSRFIAVSVGRDIVRLGDIGRLAVEATAAQHWGLSDHAEFGVAAIARWDRFFWDPVLDTSVAIGEGLSYATQVPALEVQKNGTSARLLNLLIFEVAARPFDSWPVAVFARIHHRSGAWGTYSGVADGSNFLGFGLRLYLP